MAGEANSVAAGDGETMPTQNGHLLAIDTELGKDVLLLTAVDGTETLSQSFVYTIEVLTMAEDAAVRSLLGKPVTIWLDNASPTTRRPLHGHIRCLMRGALDSRFYRTWSAEIVPWLWFLTRSVDCRIFQNLSVPDILANVFHQLGLSNYQARLIGSYPKLEFCVQYRESAFAFVSRLMEHVGIFYWFEHSAGQHLLVTSDSNKMGSFTEPRQLSLSHRADLGDIQELNHTVTIRPGIWALNDYDYKVPKKTLRVHQPTILPAHPLSRFEIYDYPGAYTSADEGAQLTRLRMEAEEARHFELTGASSCAGLDPGRRFDLVEDVGGKAATYLVTQVRHSGRDATYHSNTTTAPDYGNHFVCIPADTPFRPERVTPKPIVQGPQTATVVGPPGETIYPDQEGRVRLQFHWDRYGTSDDKSSCWVRVSQNSAGAGWGGMFIPHVGHEVIVSFLEGDPDRPMVTGRVYNGDNKKSVGLPANKTQTGMRDHSGNEIQLEGKGGMQNIHVTAVKDMNFDVAHDFNTTVHNDCTTTVNGIYKHDVTAKTATYHVQGALTENYSNTQSTMVAADITITSSGGAIAMSSWTQHVYVQAATSIQLHVGSSMIWMDSGGQIKIKGVNVSIEGSSSVVVKGGIVHSEADSEHQIKGAIVLSEGSATNTVKGGMVMLNP